MEEWRQDAVRQTLRRRCSWPASAYRRIGREPPQQVPPGAQGGHRSTGGTQEHRGESPPSLFKLAPSLFLVSSLGV